MTIETENSLLDLDIFELFDSPVLWCDEVLTPSEHQETQESLDLAQDQDEPSDDMNVMIDEILKCLCENVSDS